jgi:hypothetical protein
MSILQMAEAWGCPPWEIEDADDGAYWATRWGVYQDELRFVRKLREPKAKK